MSNSLSQNTKIMGLQKYSSFHSIGFDEKFRLSYEQRMT